MRLPIVDPPSCLPGESRCQHDMLTFGDRKTCSWCLGLRDMPDLDAETSRSLKLLSPEGFELPEFDALRWHPSEDPTRCISCDAPIRAGQQVAYLAAFQGPIGRCCEGLAA